MRRQLIVIVALILITLFAVNTVSAGDFSFSGNIASGAQYDLYTISMLAGESATATLVCDFDGTSRPLDPVLSVFFPGSDPSNTANADVYNDDGFGSDDDPAGVDCDAFDSSRVNFTAPTTGDYIFRADGFGSSTGPYTLVIHTGVSGFHSGDARINQDAWAPVAIFCMPGRRVEVYWVDVVGLLPPDVGGQSSVTGLTAIISATAAQIAATAPGANIASNYDVHLARTADGGLQVLAPQIDGKGYLFVWNACPASRTTTYVIDPVTGASRVNGTGGG